MRHIVLGFISLSLIFLFNTMPHTGPTGLTASAMSSARIDTPWLGTRQLGSSGNDNPSAVAVDGRGNIYIAGFTDGDLDGNTNAGGNDLFLVKYNAAGKKIWTRQFGTAGSDRACGVAIDERGNIYLSVTTSGDLDGNTNAGLADLSIVKYNADGKKIWTRQLGTPFIDHAQGIATNGRRNIYVAGHTDGDLDGNTNTGLTDPYLVKYDADGNKLWTRQVGTAGNEQALAVAEDGSGNIYVTADGNKLWTRQFGTAGDDEASAVAVDGSGNAYVTGYTYGDLDGNTNAGLADPFLVKYDADGNKLWTRQFGTAGTDTATGVAIDGSGNIYVTGYTYGDLDGNANAGLADLFLVKYDADGNKQ
ncbi:MAG: SBBP repeat-containing protein [Nitrospirae bacterium]|nr:SBBP repeat-containing protein [Nitrospirota bacterium]